MMYDELSALDEGEYSVGVGNGVHVPRTREGEIEEVFDLPQAILVALLGKVDFAAALQVAYLRLDEIRHNYIIRRIKLYFATGDTSIVIEMKLQRFVCIAPYERHSVNTLNLKPGEFAFQKMRLLRQSEQGEKVIEFMDEIEFYASCPLLGGVGAAVVRTGAPIRQVR